MATKRSVDAVWNGTGAEGKGSLTSSNKFFDGTPYSFKSRFQNEDGQLGTNPEELIAAAHAGCYAMALSFAIVGAGFVADELAVRASVTLDKVDGSSAITGIVLKLKGRVPGIGAEQFLALAEGAKTGCPISKALSATPISLEAELVD